MVSIINRLLLFRRLPKFSRGHFQFWIICPVGLFCGIVFLFYVCSDYEFINGLFRRKGIHEIIMDLSKNYFPSSEELSNGKFLVDNVKCKIPDISIWDPSVHPYLKRVSPFECEQVNLTYVKGQNVYFNEDMLPMLGYKELSDISCCYRTIERVQQSEERFDKEADNHFRYSKTCYPMGKVTQPKSGFIGVICKGTSLFLKGTVYKNFHLIAKIPNDDKVLAKKLRYWKQCQKDRSCKGPEGKKGRPPNVLLIGIDSTSRLNFHRHMPHSKAILQRRLGAIEMNGFTKVGENTFPNFVPFMTSYSENELTKICYENRWVPLDSCPYIWKEFSARNYLTAHLEDSPKMAIFNYMKTGFIRKPVDMYLRPWMLAAYKEKEDEVIIEEVEKDKWLVDCIGYQRPEHILLDYVVDLANLSESQEIPYFITTWLTDLTHEDMNNVQHLDSVLSNTLLKLQKEGLLDNTLLLVMSDHGYRFADVRITKSGWYEDKLPAMFIKLPSSITSRYQHWNAALKYNSRQLTTPFDIHATLQELLTTIPMATNISTHIAPVVETSTSTRQPQFPLRGLSLFNNLPFRSCEEAGIPNEYCACISPITYTKNLTIVRMAAEAVVRNINSDLPPVCTPLEVGSIIASATINSNSNGKRINNFIGKFLVAIVTEPGNFRYEALVQYNNLTDKFTQVDNVLRTNKKERDTGCLTKQEQASFELLCYCSDLIYSI